MSDDDEPVLRRTTHAHTGADFESGACDRARGRNQPMPGVEPEEAAGAFEEGGWRGGHNNYSVESGRRRKLADTPAEKTIL
eukprot:2202135-Prymnesium_polylepis.1